MPHLDVRSKIMAALRSIADAVKSEVEPLLRDLGLNGEYPHYRRNCGGRADLISFQTNKNGGSFIVEIAQTSGEGVTPFWSDDFIPFDQLNVWHLDPHRDKRKRILAGLFGLLGWFHYDRIWQRIFLRRTSVYD